jgi:hypothetical protein
LKKNTRESRKIECKLFAIKEESKILDLWATSSMRNPIGSIINKIDIIINQLLQEMEFSYAHFLSEYILVHSYGK